MTDWYTRGYAKEAERSKEEAEKILWDFFMAIHMYLPEDAVWFKGAGKRAKFLKDYSLPSLSHFMKYNKTDIGKIAILHLGLYLSLQAKVGGRYFMAITANRGNYSGLSEYSNDFEIRFYSPAPSFDFMHGIAEAACKAFHADICDMRPHDTDIRDPNSRNKTWHRFFTGEGSAWHYKKENISREN